MPRPRPSPSMTPGRSSRGRSSNRPAISRQPLSRPSMRSAGTAGSGPWGSRRSVRCPFVGRDHRVAQTALCRTLPAVRRDVRPASRRQSAKRGSARRGTCANVVFFAVAEHAIGRHRPRAARRCSRAGRRAASIAWLALNPVEREDYRKIGCLEAEVAAAGIVRRLIWRIKAGDRSRVADAVGGDLSDDHRRSRAERGA